MLNPFLQNEKGVIINATIKIIINSSDIKIKV